MQAQQIITDVRRELVETSGAYWSDAELLRLINRAESDYVRHTRMLEDSATLSLTAGRIDYPLPSNFITMRAAFFKVESTDGTFEWKRLNPTNLEKTAQENPNFMNTATANRGTPQQYMIWQRSLYLDVAPDTDNDTTLLIFYKSKPIALTAASQELNIDDSLSEAITAFVLNRAWKKESEKDKADEQQEIYDRYVAEGRKWVKKQSGDQRYRIDIDSPVPFNGNSNPNHPLNG
jgi:hypothetical protein